MYDKGFGVSASEAEAMHWLQKAAKRHFIPAEFLLGSMYETREHSNKNLAQAIHWYRDAAERGYAPAQNNLGVMYDKGVGVPQDLAQAMKWYRLAAEQGDGSAASNLAYSYADVRTGKPDPASAYFWALVALRNPSVLTAPLSPEFATSLRKRLPANEVTRIETQVDEWTKTHPSHSGTTSKDWFLPMPQDSASSTAQRQSVRPD
jgi:TPR repeat protein